MTDIKLSEGSLRAIMNGEDVANPVMQILGTKKIPGGTAERYRVLISDGVNINSFAMLATQLNDIITDGTLSEFTIVQIKRYIVSGVSSGSATNRSVLIILELNIIKPGTEIGFKIGNPQPLNTNTDNSSTQQTPAATNTNGSNGVHNNVAIPRQASAPVVQTHPIVSLSPYQNKWTIKARVTNKTPIREWNNARGSGKLFSIDLLDESGEIRATMFNDECNRFHDMIEKDKVYYISNCTLKPANKKFSSINNDYEMSFTHSTTVIPCNEDEVGNMPSVKYCFVPLKTIAEISPDENIDVLGVCIDAAELSSVTGKTNQKTYMKRDITLVDQSQASVTMTLWGKEAETFDASNKPVIAVKAARVSEFQGGTSKVETTTTISKTESKLATNTPKPIEGTKTELDPTKHDQSELNKDTNNSTVRKETNISVSNLLLMREIQDQQLGMGDKADYCNLLLMREIQDQQLGMGDKADYCSVRGIIQVFRGSNTTYKACPSQDCNKKVIDQNNGMYRCEKCNKEFNTFTYRLILPVMIGDWTNSVWVTLFQNEAESILGVTAQEVGESTEDHPALKKALFTQYIFRLRAKLEHYNDEKRLKIICAGIKPVDHLELSKKFIAEIKDLAGLGSQMDTRA
ncbi:replication protein A 70 kDa DNA-binding subunit [Diaphorina citri]|uniref:Replication protein A subunit n=1 Tax=Diaphorina citri TaxID=121845 RepID=A0A3Q0JK13_DIACI|nr:replication protein A 70 kDa DNA-binding subunit [Diaphorina citri]